MDLEFDADQENRLFNFLLFLFPYYLKTAMRKGLFKKYIHHRYPETIWYSQRFLRDIPASCLYLTGRQKA
ncbi:hypothetical protein D1841_10855 [Neglecta sp. X4]|nr:hypothetical protein [Neglectibacter sp. 59]NBJ73770.1 hypothetical protein [Neglectibacter sp. X4]NCE81462.1 hypothetical protein [Neglectibacter sp. X58]